MLILTIDLKNIREMRLIKSPSAEDMNMSKKYYKREGYSWQTNTDELFERAWADIFEKTVVCLGDIKESSKVLDVGCGKGALIPYLPKCNYVGIDISPSNIDTARERYLDKNFVLGDATKLLFCNNEFDYIICVETIEHLTIEEMKIALSEIKRVGKQGCSVVITVPNLYWLWSVIPWSFYPIQRRLSIKKFFEGVENGYVNENLLGLESFHYRFRPSFLKTFLSKYFTITKIYSTFWYNNRAIHNIFPKFQLKIMEFSRRFSLPVLKIGAVLVMKLINDKNK